MQICHAVKVICKHAESEHTCRAALVSDYCFQSYFCDDYHLRPADSLDLHVFTGVTRGIQFKSNYIWSWEHNRGFSNFNSKHTRDIAIRLRDHTAVDLADSQFMSDKPVIKHDLRRFTSMGEDWCRQLAIRNFFVYYLYELDVALRHLLLRPVTGCIRRRQEDVRSNKEIWIVNLKFVALTPSGAVNRTDTVHLRMRVRQKKKPQYERCLNHLKEEIG